MSDLFDEIAKNPALKAEFRDTIRQRAQEAAGGAYLVPGQVVTLHGKKLVIIRHMDEHPVPGHYLASEDLSDAVEVTCAPMVTLFHPKTRAWAKKLETDPVAAMRDLKEKINGAAATSAEVP